MILKGWATPEFVRESAWGLAGSAGGFGGFLDGLEVEDSHACGTLLNGRSAGMEGDHQVVGNLDVADAAGEFMSLLVQLDDG